MDRPADLRSAPPAVPNQRRPEAPDLTLDTAPDTAPRTAPAPRAPGAEPPAPRDEPTPAGAGTAIRSWTRRLAGGGWRRSFAAGALVWLASHIGYLAITLVSRMADPGWVGLKSAIRTWQQSDTNWYLIIAEDGYGPGPSTEDNRVTAFFPLYPMLIRVADPIVPGDALIAAFAVSNVALFGALVVLHRLVEHEFDEASARRAIWYLMLFPTAFFLVAGYPTGLFLLLVAGSVYAIRREHWWVAGILGGFATATRQSAMLLVLVFGLEYLRRHGWRIRWDAFAVLLVPTGLLAYMAHLAQVRGDPLMFMDAQTSWWRAAAPPWDGLWRAIKVFGELPLVTNQVNTLELVTVLLLFGLLLLPLVGLARPSTGQPHQRDAPWRIRADQWVLMLFGVVLLLFYLSYPTTKPLQPLMSISRFGLEVFPAFAILGRLGANQLVDRTYTFVALGVQPALIVHFLHGGWVA